MALSLSLEPLRQLLGYIGHTSTWKLLAIVVVLLNLKSLPCAWHIRLLKGLFTHLRSSRVRLASKLGPAALFQPMITTSRSGFLECDYNLHKSNSTYLSDFDVGRLELMVSLCSRGMEVTKKELAKEGNESFGLALAGVSCNFRREIKPYEGFEMWTRVLAWDHKWFYVVGHFVKKGAVKPKGYTLQPWRKVAKADKNHSANGTTDKMTTHPAILASGISKYVAKKGRRTIPPERILRASGLLPPKPADSDRPPLSMKPNDQGTSINATALTVGEKLTPDNAGEVLAASLTANNFQTEDWTWERVEQERLRGLKIAELFNGLDALNDAFTAENRPVLGEY